MLLSDKYPFITNYFTEALTETSGSTPQSILLYGSDLNSQYIIAKEIARLLNCKEDKSDNCQCINCRWIREDSHPAVMTISRLDNKPEDDDSKTVISMKQSALIKEKLVTDSEFHRVFIFCDRDENGNISGLNTQNFQTETANSLLKIIEEPQTGVTFIFLCRYIEDLLPTIISRCQCFFIPTKDVSVNLNFDLIRGIFENYWEIERNDIFNVSQKLLDLTKVNSTQEILQNIQNYITFVLKNNPKRTQFIEHVKVLEEAMKQEKLGIKSANIFDNICLKLIK